MAQKPSAGSPSTYAGFGIQFVVAILVFAYAGSWVDRYLGSRPLFLVLGVFVGAGGTFYSMYRRVMSDAGARTNKRDGP
ncbi:MAG: AtpZ/AtpI family protein [Gemmatimonadaceae bacterium]